MSLPFAKDDGSRKFTCFVCGIQHNNFEEYNKHIIESHEEGREYVKCPLAHCGSAVRDVRMHIKAKHPNFEVPKSGQMRAIVWKDVKDGKLKRRKPKFKEGFYQSTKMNKPIHYRSGWEATIYECLDHDIEVNSFDVEPMKIPYLHKGKQHDYIPDIIIKFVDGHTELWECKPSSQTALEKNQDKWHAAKQACDARGWIFEVKTEVGIEKLKNKVRNQKKLTRFFDDDQVDDLNE